MIKLFLLTFSINVFCQAVSVSEGSMFENQTVAASATATYQGGVKFSTGVSFNVQIQCTGICSGKIEFKGSNDQANWETIPDVTQNFTASDNFLFNIFNIKFLYYLVLIENLGATNIIVNGYHAEKSQI